MIHLLFNKTDMSNNVKHKCQIFISLLYLQVIQIIDHHGESHILDIFSHGTRMLHGCNFKTSVLYKYFNLYGK